jgi:methionyl-tRNA formyltransferase
VRVVFMGTPEFAVPSLLALDDAAEVVGVFCRPDSVSGRGKGTRPGPVKLAAHGIGSQVFQPRTLRDDAALATLLALQPDLIVVAAYGLILPLPVLEAAPLGAINVHASLLPRWRGAAPIQRAILAGDSVTGVSIMRMEEGLDTGPYCLQASTPVGTAGAVELTERLALLGADALVQALPGIVGGFATWTSQDVSLATYADKIGKSDVAIDPSLPAATALRRIRASAPAAPCRIRVTDRSVTLTAASSAALDNPDLPPAGAVVADKTGILLGLSDGAVLVRRLKPEGKSEMTAADWARGVRDLDCSTWGGVE